VDTETQLSSTAPVHLHIKVWKGWIGLHIYFPALTTTSVSYHCGRPSTPCTIIPAVTCTHIHQRPSHANISSQRTTKSLARPNLQHRRLRSPRRTSAPHFTRHATYNSFRPTRDTTSVPDTPPTTHFAQRSIQLASHNTFRPRSIQLASQSRHLAIDITARHQRSPRHHNNNTRSLRHDKPIPMHSLQRVQAPCTISRGGPTQVPAYHHSYITLNAMYKQIHFHVPQITCPSPTRHRFTHSVHLQT
jgi:hypothetical protein